MTSIPLPDITTEAAHAARLRSGIVLGSALLLVAVSTAVAYVVAGSGNRSYGAQAEVLFETSTPATASNGLPRDLATQKVVVRSRAVLTPVARATGVSVDELSRSLSVSVVGQSDVLRLTASRPSRAAALQMARAIASSYVGVVGRTFGAGLQAGRARLEHELEQLSSTLSDVDTQAGRLEDARQEQLARGRFAPASTKQLRLQAESQILLQRIATLQDRVAALELQRVTQPAAQILTPAYELEKPLGPRPLRAAAAGVLIGLVLAVGLVFVLRQQRRR